MKLRQVLSSAVPPNLKAGKLKSILNSFRMDGVAELKKEYCALERNVLLLIVIPLPFFAYAYLYTTGQSKSLSVPQLPEQVSILLLMLAVAGLLLQFIRVKQGLKTTRNGLLNFDEKFLIYVRVTMERYWILLGVGFICAVGLFFFENPGFTIAYAVCLLVISLGKPTPERIIGSLRLKKGEKDKVYEISKREDL